MKIETQKEILALCIAFYTVLNTEGIPQMLASTVIGLCFIHNICGLILTYQKYKLNK